MKAADSGEEVYKGNCHIDNISVIGDNSGDMTRNLPKKSQIMTEISLLLGIPEIAPTVGSSIPSVFFTSIAAEMGIHSVHGMPAMARKIIENSHLTWYEEFSSELAPSGGGGTVTALGLLQVKNAILVWQGLEAEPLPTEMIFEEWKPDENWEHLRNLLPKTEQEVTTRPGASAFREMVLTEYDNQCVVTGFRTVEVIEIAHIVPYYGTDSDEIQNALPLRSDIHKLFDRGLLRIVYDNSTRKYITLIHDYVMDDYSDYHEKKLIMPHDSLSSPSKAALLEQHKIHKRMWQII